MYNKIHLLLSCENISTSQTVNKIGVILLENLTKVLLKHKEAPTMVYL